MRVIKLVYNSETEHNVLSIIDKVKTPIFLETYNFDHYKQRKNAILLMTRHGAKKLPILIFEDENTVEYAAYWPESKKELTPELIQEFLDV